MHDDMYQAHMPAFREWRVHSAAMHHKLLLGEASMAEERDAEALRKFVGAVESLLVRYDESSPYDLLGEIDDAIESLRLAVRKIERETL